MTRRERRLDQRRRRVRARRCRFGAFVVTTGLGYAGAQAIAGAGSRSSHEAWVESAFDDLLGRPVGDEGLATWTGRLDAGIPAATLADELVESHEFNARLVAVLYDHYLGRAPDAEGAAAWVAQLDAGVPVVVVEAALLSSSEYADTDADLVDGLYTDVLGRPADAAGRAHWLDMLERGTPRMQVAELVLRSREAARHRSQEALRSFLGGQPDRAQVQRLATSLRSTADWPGQWARIAASDEYRQAVDAGGDRPGHAGARVLAGA